MSNLKTYYNNVVVAKLMEQFNYSSVMAVPKLEKIVVNIGVGDAVANSKNLDAAVEELAALTGQSQLLLKLRNLFLTLN